MHLITEAYRRAYMDRADYLGDPDYNQIPGGRADRQEIRRRVAAQHLTDKASPSDSLKRPDGFLPPAPATAGHRARVAGHDALLCCR